MEWCGNCRVERAAQWQPPASKQIRTLGRPLSANCRGVLCACALPSRMTAGLLSPTTLPGIQCLTALEDLGVSSCGVEPSFLLLMATSLTRLSLEYATLQPSDSTLGASQLLQVLARLPALRLLELRNISGQWPQQLPAYSALTASSNVQELVACGCDVPGAAWAHAFPASRQLPHLWRFEGRPHDEPYKCPGPGPFDSTGIIRLASCCPALDTLGITSEDASLAPLHPLTALTSLRVGPLSPAVISSHLAALSQLQELYVSVADRDDDTPAWHQHLVPLTALRNLTHICCLLDVDSEEDEKEFQEAQDFAVYTWQGVGYGKLGRRVTVLKCVRLLLM